MKVYVNLADMTGRIAARTLKWRRYATHRSDLSFVMEIHNSDDISIVCGMPVKLCTDTENTVWGGIITDVITLRRSENRSKITVRCKGYESIIARRASYVIALEGQSCGEIAKALFLQYFAENAAFGGEGFLFSENNFDKGGDVSGYICPGARFSKIFDDLAGISGYKWWTDKDKYFYFRKDIPITEGLYSVDTTMADPRALKDISNLEFSGLTSEYRNVQIVLGKNDVRGEARNLNEIARMAAYGGSGEYANVTVNRNILSEAEATAAAENILRSYETESKSVSFTTSSDGLELFDRIYVRAPEYGITALEPFVITEISAVSGVNGRYGTMGLLYSVTAKRSDEKTAFRPSDDWKEAFSQFTTRADSGISGSGASNNGGGSGNGGGQGDSGALHADNIIAGRNITLSVDGKNVTINSNCNAVKLKNVDFTDKSVTYTLADDSVVKYACAFDGEGRIKTLTTDGGEVITVNWL